MGQYVIVESCVVAGRHYVRPTIEEFDDDLVAPLVEAGSLEPYTAAAQRLKRNPETEAALVAAVADIDQAVEVEIDDEPPTDPPPPRRSRGKRSGG